MVWQLRGGKEASLISGHKVEEERGEISFEGGRRALA